jgi:hypothetical protein
MDSDKLKWVYGILAVIAVLLIIIGSSLWGTHDPNRNSALEAGQTMTMIGVNMLVTMGLVLLALWD